LNAPPCVGARVPVVRDVAACDRDTPSDQETYARTHVCACLWRTHHTCISRYLSYITYLCDRRHVVRMYRLSNEPVSPSLSLTLSLSRCIAYRTSLAFHHTHPQEYRCSSRARARARASTRNNVCNILIGPRPRRYFIDSRHVRGDRTRTTRLES